MKKGFTLIELLAVIVILAIIALIATPIILGIINDARRESNKRSAELYVLAVRNAIASYQLINPNAPTKFSDLALEYDGEVECSTEELYKDGSFYITDCEVNGDEVNYTYGTKRYEPQYYYFGSDFSGTVGETSTPSNPSIVPPSGKNFYLGYDVTNGVVSTAYACFIRNEIEYCLKAGDEGAAFDTNTEIIKDAFADVLDDACSFEDHNPDEGGYANCYDGGVEAHAGSFGSVRVMDSYAECYVSDDGYFSCNVA